MSHCILDTHSLKCSNPANLNSIVTVLLNSFDDELFVVYATFLFYIAKRHIFRS